MPRTISSRYLSHNTGRLTSTKGFTLIELLVVVVIISILLSMATIAITSGTPKERLKTEAQRFTALVQLAQDEALLNNTELGLVLTRESYQFVNLSDAGWGPLENNNTLRERFLPNEMQLELELDYQASELQSSITKVADVDKVGDVNKFNDDKQKKFQPQVYLLSSGEITPSFLLTFQLADIDQSFTVEGKEEGSLEIQYNNN